MIRIWQNRTVAGRQKVTDRVALCKLLLADRNRLAKMPTGIAMVDFDIHQLAEKCSFRSAACTFLGSQDPKSGLGPELIHGDGRS
jgi:hypothetical protein